MPSFEESLATGKVGESEIAAWFKARGYHVLPVYEIEKNQFAGPAVFACDGRQLVAPDMLCFGGEKTWWIEAKHKTAFSWHRKTQRFVTGIDLHHYEQYQQVADLADWPVWLLFLHKGGQAKDSPPSPAGLYGGEITELTQCENHRHHNHGKSGMVYWAEKTLKRIDDYPFTRAAA